MNKKIIYVVVGVVVLCVAYPGCAWLIGLRVEASMAKREQTVRDQFPGTVTLISRHYQRGVFGATEDLTYGVGTPTLSALGPITGIPDLSALRITVRNTIHHGPLPQFRSIGLATVSTDVTLPPQLSAKLRQLLGGAPAFQIHSRLGWLGGTTTVIESPDHAYPVSAHGRLTMLNRAVIGVDGDCAFALLGENLQEGEAEFQMIALPTKVTQDPHRYHLSEWCDAARLAGFAALSVLKDRLKDPTMTYALGPSHPDYC